MPPKRGYRRGGRARGTSGRPKATQTPGQWPHLKSTKQKPEPLDPLPSNAFLTLKVPGLALWVAEREWPLLSSKALLIVSQITTNGNEDATKDEKRNLRSQEHQTAKRTIRYTSFITLRYGKTAWERSSIPLAQLWRDHKTISLVPEPGTLGGPYIEAIKSSRKSFTETVTVTHLSTEREPPTQLPTPTESVAPFDTSTSSVSRGSNRSPIAPDFSPITPVFLREVLPLTPAESVDLQRSHIQTGLDNSDSYEMSGKPSVDVGGVDESIKDVIQNLFVMQHHVASFRPEQQEGLNRKVEDIAVSLQKLDELVSDTSNPIHNIKVAPDIIDYVDDGRNPDIYTRDFVELVQRGNAVMNGKQKAFRDFSKIFAKALKENFEGMSDEVDTIMDNAGMEDKNGTFIEKQQNGNRA